MAWNTQVNAADAFPASELMLEGTGPLRIVAFPPPVDITVIEEGEMPVAGRLPALVTFMSTVMLPFKTCASGMAVMFTWSIIPCTSAAAEEFIMLDPLAGLVALAEAVFTHLSPYKAIPGFTRAVIDIEFVVFILIVPVFQE